MRLSCYCNGIWFEKKGKVVLKAQNVCGERERLDTEVDGSMGR